MANCPDNVTDFPHSHYLSIASETSRYLPLFHSSGMSKELEHQCHLKWQQHYFPEMNVSASPPPSFLLINSMIDLFVWIVSFERKLLIVVVYASKYSFTFAQLFFILSKMLMVFYWWSLHNYIAIKNNVPTRHGFK